MTDRTATQAYEEHRDAILALLDELRGDLGMHNVHFDRAGRRDWGFPGDLAHVRELLQEAHDFLNSDQE